MQKYSRLTSLSWREVVRLGIYVTNFLFISYLFLSFYLRPNTGIPIDASLHQATLIHTYKTIRSYFYVSYLILGIIAVVDIFLLRSKSNRHKSYIIALVVGFVLSTFAYAITGLLVDITLAITLALTR